jgi:hypothetical protein
VNQPREASQHISCTLPLLLPPSCSAASDPVDLADSGEPDTRSCASGAPRAPAGAVIERYLAAPRSASSATAWRVTSRAPTASSLTSSTVDGSDAASSS